MTSIHNAVAPFRVLIAGGSYAGLSSAVNLLDLCHGRSPRMAQEAYVHHPNHKHIPVDITIVDERDGFCKFHPCFISAHFRPYSIVPLSSRAQKGLL